MSRLCLPELAPNRAIASGCAQGRPDPSTMEKVVTLPSGIVMTFRLARSRAKPPSRYGVSADERPGHVLHVVGANPNPSPNPSTSSVAINTCSVCTPRTKYANSVKPGSERNGLRSLPDQPARPTRMAGRRSAARGSEGAAWLGSCACMAWASTRLVRSRCCGIGVQRWSMG